MSAKLAFLYGHLRPERRHCSRPHRRLQRAAVASDAGKELFLTPSPSGIEAAVWAGPVAQWSEPAAHNRLVAGSSPAGPTINLNDLKQDLRCQATVLARQRLDRPTANLCSRPNGRAPVWPRRPIGAHFFATRHTVSKEPVQPKLSKPLSTPQCGSGAYRGRPPTEPITRSHGHPVTRSHARS